MSRWMKFLLWTYSILPIIYNHNPFQVKVSLTINTITPRPQNRFQMKYLGIQSEPVYRSVIAVGEDASTRGPGHDSSVGEWMYLTICSPHGPCHDSSVGEWMYLAVGFNSQPIPWLFTLCQPALSQRGRKWLNLPSTCGHWVRRPKSNHGQRMAEIQTNSLGFNQI